MNVKLDDVFLEQLLLQARESPRKRSHYNLHKELNEPCLTHCYAVLNQLTSESQYDRRQNNAHF